MKWDEVYEFFSRGPKPTTMTKTELALHYLAEIYRVHEGGIRFASVPGLPSVHDEAPTMLLGPRDYIDFTRDDIMEYLVSEGAKLKCR